MASALEASLLGSSCKYLEDEDLPVDPLAGVSGECGGISTKLERLTGTQ